jgi:hypothetical protein
MAQLLTKIVNRISRIIIIFVLFIGFVKFCGKRVPSAA